MDRKQIIMISVSNHKLVYGILSGLVVLIFFSCKPSVPDRLIQPDDMRDILYDYYIAQSIANQSADDSLAMISFKANILKKHGVTDALFDSSMVYYTRHTKELHDIYQSLSDRLGNEALSQGASANEMAKYGNIDSSADTTNIWKWERTVVLAPYEACNDYSFLIEADTAYHKGDRVMLDFDSQFIYQDGMRDAVAVLAVKFGNDSVMSQVVRISSTSHYHVQVDDGARLGIKEIKGYFLVNNPTDASTTTTLRMFVVSGIRLIKMHMKEPAVPSSNETEKTDSDSIKSNSGNIQSLSLPSENRNVQKRRLRTTGRILEPSLSR